MVVSRQLGNASIITAECIDLRDSVPTATYNGFSNLEIGGNSKVVIDCYNKKKKSNLPSSIILLIEDIWRLSKSLNIFNCYHIYREANRTSYYLVKKGICNPTSSIWWSNFLRDVRKYTFEDYCELSFI